MLLAAAGLKVRVFERAQRVGGPTSAVEGSRFRFDCGPTFFLYPRILEEIFAAVGRNLWQKVPMARLNPHYRVFFGDGDRLDASPDIDQL